MKAFPRPAALALALAMGFTAPAFAQLSIQFNTPGANIGVNLGGYPTLQPIPGYPVYYAPSLNQNYFFYDGMYWLYQNDNWYASSWYNGPWGLVDPYNVPVYLLRVPVRYYRHPPAYFRGWRADAPPRWDQHWGREWHDRHVGWDHWDRRSAPRPAPLPHYQREYNGNRYPDAARQAAVQQQHYNYQPRENVSRQHYEERRQQAQQAPQGTSQRGNSIPHETRDGHYRDRNGQSHDAGGATRDPNHSGG
jgi:hypothetical protein